MRSRRRADRYQREFELEYHQKVERYIEHDYFGDVSEGVLESAIKSMDFPPIDQSIQEDNFISKVKDKFVANHLSQRNVDRIASVIEATKTVERFINDRMMYEFDFNLRLRSAFLSEFKKLADQGAGGDALFDGVLEGIRRRIADVKAQGAALPILAHLFIVCDIFLRPGDEI